MPARATTSLAPPAKARALGPTLGTLAVVGLTILAGAASCGAPDHPLPPEARRGVREAAQPVQPAPEPQPLVPFTVGGWDKEQPHGGAASGESPDESLGNHRVLVRVGEEGARGGAVRIHVPWRRRDRDPESKDLRLVDGQTGRRIRNLFRLNVGRESGDLAFEPASGAGAYYLYYLPHLTGGRSNYPTVRYLPPEETADSAWLARNGLGPATPGAADRMRLPEAEVVEIQSVDSFNSFFPMEVIATPAEVEDLLGIHPGAPFLVFPEDREHSIRMASDLPFRWVRRGAGGTFRGQAERCEFYAFQVGLWAARAPVVNVSARFSDLVHSGGGGRIPASAFSAFNLEGVDSHGRPFRKELAVPEGQVQALWFGVQVPEGARPGLYEGELVLSGLVSATDTGPAGNGRAADRAHEERIPLILEVSQRVIPAHGDDEPTRLSRLRWLDSRLALDDRLVSPFTPVTVSGDRISVLGRTVTLGADGFPARIQSYFAPEMTHLVQRGREVLAGPVALVVEDAEGAPVAWRSQGPRFTRRVEGVAAWEVAHTAGPLTMDVRAEMEFDGTLEFAVALASAAPVEIADVRLEIPVALGAARYMMGMGYPGGHRPERLEWSWAVERNQDGAWIGDVNAGLQFSMRDERYERPLNTNFYLSKPLVMPASWANDGAGGCRFEEVAQARAEAGVGEAGHTPPARRAAAVVTPGAFLVRCFSGRRTLEPGVPVRYDFRLALTPFKPLDTDAQWRTRFFHRFEPLDSIRAMGANVVNVHHATPINPFINYPFLRPAEMKAYVDDAHRRGMRVKIYYTVRELTNRAPELFALFSLGDEVLSSGPGGGFSWLQEHLKQDYIAGWLVPSLEDAAVVNSGVSRWHNFYLEGLHWLVRNVGIDGLYIDDVAFDRVTMKRVRKILDRGGAGKLIDLHSANQFNVRDGFASSANLYLEHFPYIDRLWFGEYFDYDSPPEFWMVELSGIPFGLMGEMLQDGGNPWRGMLYGMTTRLPWAGDPRPLWEAWDEFGMDGTSMVGYWVPDSPVRTGRDDVLATAYVKEGRTLVALASWAPEPAQVSLAVDWGALGLDAARVRIRAPAIRDFQEGAQFAVGEPIEVRPGRGWLLVFAAD